MNLYRQGIPIGTGFKVNHQEVTCPSEALEMGTGGFPLVNRDRCIGCRVCATGCPENAVSRIKRTGIAPPPENRKALREAVKAGRK